MFWTFLDLSLTLFKKLHLPRLPNIYPYDKKIPQEFRQPLTPCIPLLLQDCPKFPVFPYN